MLDQEIFIFWVIQILLRITYSVVFLEVLILLNQLTLNFENGNFNGSAKIRDIVFKEEGQIVIIPIVLNRIDDASVESLLKLSLLPSLMILFLTNS